MHRSTYLAAAAACALVAAPALAQSSGEWDLGTIYATANNYCPDGTLEAAGQVLPVNTYQALYSLMGNTYGGTPPATFALPDLRARIPTGYNTTNGAMKLLPWGSSGGIEPVPIILSVAQMPAHNHTGTTAQLANGAITATLNASTTGPSAPNPAGNSLATFPGSPIYAPGAPAGPSAMSAGSVTATLGSTGVNVNVAPSGANAPIPMARSPYIALRYCIVTSGLYPPRP